MSIEDSQYGNYLSGIAGEFAPDDREWFWNLHSWNEANATWELSNLDLDAYAEPGHIAWAPSFVNVSTVPSPNVGARRCKHLQRPRLGNGERRFKALHVR